MEINGGCVLCCVVMSCVVAVSVDNSDFTERKGSRHGPDGLRHSPEGKSQEAAVRRHCDRLTSTHCT